MLVMFGIAFGGILICGLAAALIISLFGFESSVTRVTLIVLIAPALISSLLGIGLGCHAYDSSLERDAQRTAHHNESAGERESDELP